VDGRSHCRVAHLQEEGDIFAAGVVGHQVMAQLGGFRVELAAQNAGSVQAAALKR
jgi:hypothetical protein